MILQRLVNYYDRLAADPNDPMTPSGFSREKISFSLVITADGEQAELKDERDQQGTKLFPRMMAVPDRGGRSGTALKPNFLWDNSGYVLGRDSKGNPERSRQAFESFRDFHQRMAETIQDEELSAVAKFLAKWSPDRAETFPLFEEALDKNIAFRLKGRMHFVHESPTIVRDWKAPATEGETIVMGQSLVNGDVGPIARLHPLISGVKDAQTMGAAIASFNLDAFTSYGLKQTYNAPVTVKDAFKYTTALNRLLENRHRRVQLGDATVIFWAERPTLMEDAVDALFGDFQPPIKDATEDIRRVEQVKLFLTQLHEGHAHAEALALDSVVGFYVLGLSPNASRISVRFWIDTNTGQMKRRLAQHMEEVDIVGSDPDRPLTLRRMIGATARTIGGEFDYSAISPRLAGELSRAFLQGRPYPRQLLAATLERIGAEGVIDATRAAVLKACLLREERTVMDPYLKKDHPEPAYHCGRLLAVLAFAQEKALKTVNSGVIRRTLGSVMATPGLQLGRLQRAAEVGHIPKLEGSLPSFVRDELKFINSALCDEVPLALRQHEQAIFMLGFYQQLQYLDFVGSQVDSGRRIRTAQGEWVRSKGERRVAELLTKLGLTYIFEPSAQLKSGSERWPDFVIRGNTRKQDVYIEYLGMDTLDYNQRWDQKLQAYHDFGINEAGDKMGRLIILDSRKKRLDHMEMINLLRPILDVNDDTARGAKLEIEEEDQ